MTVLWLLGVRPQRTELLGSAEESGIGTCGYRQAEPYTSRLTTVHTSLHLLHHLATEGPEAGTAQPQ